MDHHHWQNGIINEKPTVLGDYMQQPKMPTSPVHENVLKSQNLFGDRPPLMIYEFLVKKHDTVFEKLGPKRPLLELVVNRHLSAVSCEQWEFSCIAISVKRSSSGPTGLLLKIHTTKEIQNKRYIFINELARERFIQLLERAKENITSVQEIELVSGERTLEQVAHVTLLLLLLGKEHAIRGRMIVTNYRVIFQPYASHWSFCAFQVPIATIETVTRDDCRLCLKCKDFRTIYVALHDAQTNITTRTHKSKHHWIKLLVLRIQAPNHITRLFAFVHRIDDVNRDIGWKVYSPIAEYQRLGFLGSNTWRLLQNSKFRFSPTYPQLLIVPASLTETQLIESARFRSRARLPVAVWKHPEKNCVLARSSQPNYGVAGNRSESDRQVVFELRLGGELYVIDARKPLATKGNRLRGKGGENSLHYDNAIVEFMYIANIHKMRESVKSLSEFVAPCAIADGDKHYHSRLENTRWLKHIMRILSSASRIAEILHEHGTSVLVHCSDGWDRTPQLVATAELILDPYYRTIKGFAVLIEKEWCSFGHKFADRIGMGKDANELPHERSPVMLQWLDCVWQMTHQFPTSFEFNQTFLMHIVTSLTSGMYGTFLCNSERERHEQLIWEKTESVWTPVLLNMTKYTNPRYEPTMRPIYPRANLKKIVLWDELYCQFDPENGPAWDSFLHQRNMAVPLRDAIPQTRRLTAENALTVELDSAYEDEEGVHLSSSVSSADDEDGIDVLTKQAERRYARRDQVKKTISNPCSSEQLDELLRESLAREIDLESTIVELKNQILFDK